MVDLTRTMAVNPEARLSARLPASASEGLGAFFESGTLTEFLGVGMSASEANRTDQPGFFLQVDPETGQVERFDPKSGKRVEATNRVSPSELNDRYGHLGLDFEKAMTAEAAAIMADAKRAELVRDDIINRAPSGILANVGYLGAGVLATALDPLELAASFIPVVGPARRAALAARFGRVGGAATAGTIEGVVGSALIEPLIVGAASRVQLDYDMQDALLSIAAGGLLGGALGGVAGAFSRRLQERPASPDFEKLGLPEPESERLMMPEAVAIASPASRQAALRSSVAQLAEGRVVDVRAHFPEGTFGTDTPIAVREAAAPAQVRPISLGQFLADRGMSDEAGELSQIGADLWHRLPRERGEIGFRRRLIREGGLDLDQAAEIAAEAGYIPERSVRGLLDALDEELRGNRVVSREDASDEAQFVADLDAAEQAQEFRTRHQSAMDEAQAELGDIPELPEIADMMINEGLSPAEAVATRDARWAAIEREALPERDYQFEPERFDRSEPFDLFEAEEWELAEMIEGYRAAGQLTEADEAALAEAADMVRHAEDYAATAREVSACLAR